MAHAAGSALTRKLHCSSSAPNEHTRLLEEAGCSTSVCPPNREQQLTAILGQAPPDICIFDRYQALVAWVTGLAPSQSQSGLHDCMPVA